MRQTFDDVMRAGVPHSPNTFDGKRKIPPKYDPVTGEIIRPLAIKDDTPRSVIPIEAVPDEVPLEAIPITPKLDYSRSRVGSPTIAMASAFVQLLKPGNLVVMFFVWIGHLLLFASGFAGFTGVFILVVLLLSLMAHYGNVIDEVGPADRDELPVLLRNVSISEDLWRPFVNVIISLFLCFAPALFVQFSHLPTVPKYIGIVMCLVAGFALAPAVLLTMLTSGAYANFRPDRLMSVIRISGIRYVIAISTFTAASAIYLAALGTTSAGLAALVGSPSLAAGLGGLGTGALIFALAIYLMHVAAWQIGLLYRAHQPDFPWVLQRHTYTKLAERNRPAAPRSATAR